jgi:hypothetical protein
MKLDIRYSLVVIACGLLTGCGKPVETLPPEGFTVHATLSADTLTVGDPATLTLTARHPAGSTIHFPTIGNGKQIVTGERASENRKLTETVLESEEMVQLTSFRVGDWPLTPNAVVCTFADGTQKMQTLPELVLHVQSSLNEANATKLSDIKDIVKPPLQLSRTLWILLVVALLALMAGLLTILFRRKSRPIPHAPPTPPHIIAQQALAALRGKQWAPEPFFTELSLILRTYLENRFHLHAPESTTEELTRSMASDARLGLKEQQTLRNFMTQADLVKFARADAEQDVMQNAFSTIETFIEQTTQTDPSDLAHQK